MKKRALILILIFLTINIFSQINKGDFIISSYGNYNQSTYGTETLTNKYIVNGKYLDIGASVEYFLKENLILGIGLDYLWTKEERTSSTLINIFYHTEFMDFKSKILLPNIYLGYYYQIMNKFYINSIFKLNYGKLKSDFSTEYAGATFTYSDDFESFSSSDYGYVDNYYKSIDGSSQLDYISAQLLPELTYFISQRFSINLGLGGIEFSLKDWELDNSDWLVSFNPTYWKLGFKIRV